MSANPNFHIDIEYGHLCAIGELDLAAAGAVSYGDELVPCTKRVVLDLGRVTFIDAAGLGAVVDLRNRLMRAGRSLSITNVPQQRAYVFDIAGLASLLNGARAAA